MVEKRAFVTGHPIAHSRSPKIHRYWLEEYGIDGSYQAIDVRPEDFAAFLKSLGENGYRGGNVTIPHKEAAFAGVARRDEAAELTGAVNTLLFGERLRGFNTDVRGLTQALRAGGLGASRTGRIVGGGATARSAVVSLARLGVTDVEFRTRRIAQAHELAEFGEGLGLRVRARALEDAAPLSEVDLTVSTLPGDAVLPDAVAAALARAGGALFSAAYAPWPTALAQAWADAPVLTGLEMLLHQAVAQIRIFLHGTPDEPLPDEGAVLGAMRAALG